MTKAKAVPPVTFVTKLGAAKGVPKSRIWIEGKRLIDAGFTPGRYFAKEWATTRNPANVMLRLTLLAEDDVVNTAPCKVSGKGEKPIIDITGEVVKLAFGDYHEKVECTFTPGVIVIKGDA